LRPSLDAIRTVIDSMTIDVLVATEDQTWPFVVVPHFDLLAAKTLSVVDLVSIGYHTVVTDDQREEWEAFTRREGDKWINATVDLQRRHKNYLHPFKCGTTIEASMLFMTKPNFRQH